MRFNDVTAGDMSVRAYPQAGVFLSEPEVSAVKLPGTDGQLLLGITQAPRELPVVLRASADDETALTGILDAATGWLASGPAQLVFDELPDRGWTARLGGPLVWVSAGRSLAVTADVTFVADDPHPYALDDDVTTLAVAGDVVRAAGNAASWPTIDVEGVLDGDDVLTLTLFGQTVAVTGPLAAGETLRLDYQAYSFAVVAGGVPVRLAAGHLSTLRRVSCPVGGGAVSWTLSGGTVTSVTVHANSRWL